MRRCQRGVLLEDAHHDTHVGRPEPRIEEAGEHKEVDARSSGQKADQEQNPASDDRQVEAAIVADPVDDGSRDETRNGEDELEVGGERSDLLQRIEVENINEVERRPVVGAILHAFHHTHRDGAKPAHTRGPCIAPRVGRGAERRLCLHILVRLRVAQLGTDIDETDEEEAKEHNRRNHEVEREEIAMQQVDAPLTQHGRHRRANAETGLHKHHPGSGMRLEERSRDGICTNFEESLTSAHKEEAHARHKEVHGELKEEATHNTMR